MKLRWLSQALAELDRVYEYISQENPKAAKFVFTRIREESRKLRRFPHSGRVGQVAGTRELIVAGLPYLVVYRISSDTVEVMLVLHTAMDRPPLGH